jgi:glycosyltransferase involved in cell wall biosynthesis
MVAPLDVSVVVPTYNRADQLARVLQSLSTQTTVTASGAPFSFEIVVVSDGSVDHTPEVIESFRQVLPLQFIEQENGGPAVARNLGVENANGSLIVFIDDDVVAGPTCLAAHVECHQASSPLHPAAPTADRLASSKLVVIGPMSTPTDFDLSPWVSWEQHQLEKQYLRFAEDPTAQARQFYTGNASLAAGHLAAVGGFDPAFRRAEDVELAQRLERIGLTFVFESRAEATHYADRPFESWIGIAHDYGVNDVAFARRGQRQILDDIGRFFGERNVLQRVVVTATLRMPTLERLLGATLRWCAPLVSRVGAKTVGRFMLSALYGINYYNGVHEAVGSTAATLRLLRRDPVDAELSVWMVLEQTLGHVTHSKNLRALVPEMSRINAEFLPITDELMSPWQHLPGWKNWTVRAGIRARRALRAARRRNGLPDALLVHSQVPAVLIGRWMRRIPTVVSLDATPQQYDELGQFYSHETGGERTEKVKFRLNQSCYERASHLVTWSEWAKRGLVEGYGIDAEKVSVIAPGVDLERWSRPTDWVRRPGPVRVLFVGGDVERKGGRTLLEAAARLRSMEGAREFEVRMVTPANVEPVDGGVIIHGLTANDPALVEEYRQADVFCLPTKGDCLPMVLAEAGAMGLPLVSTDVGAISSLVRDGETGRLTRPGDVDELVSILRELIDDEALRDRFGAASKELVCREHDARRNAEKLVEVLRSIADNTITEQRPRKLFRGPAHKKRPNKAAGLSKNHSEK